jgi:DNA-binding CsgD family transcriptional regulator
VLHARAAAELGESSGIDLLILHEVADGEALGVMRRSGRTPVVLVREGGVGGSVRQEAGRRYGSAVIESEDPSRILAAATAAAHGLHVCESDDRKPRDGIPGASTEGDLTAREREVLQMVSMGRSNRRIAEALGISENTVKYHLGGLYGKLGVSNRAEAAFEAVRRGLISL